MKDLFCPDNGIQFRKCVINFPRFTIERDFLRMENDHQIINLQIKYLIDFYCRQSIFDQYITVFNLKGSPSTFHIQLLT